MMNQKMCVPKVDHNAPCMFSPAGLALVNTKNEQNADSIDNSGINRAKYMNKPQTEPPTLSFESNVMNQYNANMIVFAHLIIFAWNLRIINNKYHYNYYMYNNRNY